MKAYLLFALLVVDIYCSGADIVNAATKQLGVPYVYGGGDYNGKFRYR